MADTGRVTGSREPSPSSTGLGPSGFDPARWEGRLLIRCMGGAFCKHGAGQCTADPEFQRYLAWQRGLRPPADTPPHKVPVWLSSADVLEAINELARRGVDKAACWDFSQAIYALAGQATAIATETRRAETTKIGSVEDEGAGRRHRPTPQTKDGPNHD